MALATLILVIWDPCDYFWNARVSADNKQVERSAFPLATGVLKFHSDGKLRWITARWTSFAQSWHAQTLTSHHGTIKPLPVQALHVCSAQAELASRWSVLVVAKDSKLNISNCRHAHTTVLSFRNWEQIFQLGVVWMLPIFVTTSKSSSQPHLRTACNHTTTKLISNKASKARQQQ